MRFQAITAPTVQDLFGERIEALILSGRLSPGERLPSERELAEEMKISKTVVHAGLKELERMGFVAVNARQGTFVSNYAETGNFETLEAILKFNGGKLDDQNVRSILEMRLAVEGQACRLFAKVRSDGDIAKLRAKIAYLRGMTAENPDFDRAKMAGLLYQFHHFICLRSGNTIFPLIMNAFQNVGVVFWENSVRIYGVEESLSILDHLTDLLEARDAERAVSYLAGYFDDYLLHV